MTTKKKSKKSKRSKRSNHSQRPTNEPRLYALEVELISGRMTNEFYDKNPRVLRTILIRGDQTLDELHFAIFDAFDRFDEHLYQFEIGGKKPHAEGTHQYMIPEIMSTEDDILDELFGRLPSKRIDSTIATIESLRLNVGRRFFYWFDFGDDWWHKVTVKSKKKDIPDGEYPQVISKTGESPPQYPNLWGDDDYDLEVVSDQQVVRHPT